MDRFADMRCFVQVVDLGSVTKAANAMRVAPSAVSRRIKELEAMETVSVKYEERHKGRSAVLRSGVYTSLSWFPTPVMWCSPTEEEEEEKVIPKDGKLPLSTTSAVRSMRRRSSPMRRATRSCGPPRRLTAGI